MPASPKDTMTRPSKIISGGQTGVDRAALDFAESAGFHRGGWAPRGWAAEDGAIPERHRPFMRETPSADYGPRTILNMRDCTAALIVFDSARKMSPGTRKSIGLAERTPRPYFTFDLNAYEFCFTDLWKWLGRFKPRSDDSQFTLNIAGPRESKAPGIYAATLALLREVWP